MSIIFSSPCNKKLPNSALHQRSYRSKIGKMKWNQSNIKTTQSNGKLAHLYGTTTEMNLSKNWKMCATFPTDKYRPLSYWVLASLNEYPGA